MRPALALLGNLFRLAVAPLWWLLRRRRGDRRWVRLRLRRRLSLLAPRRGRLEQLLRRNLPTAATSLADVGELTRALRADDAVVGLLVHVPRMQAGWAACQGLRDLMVELVAAGKQVVVHLPEGAGQRELFVASAASRVVVAPSGQVQLLGLASQTPYLRKLLDRVGIEPQVHAVGDYKTAGEQFERSEMSEPQREQVGAVLSTVQQTIDDALAERPAIEAGSVAALFEHGIWDADAATAAGLVDGAAYDDQLAVLTAESPAPVPREAGPYLAAERARLWQPVRPPPFVRVVPIQGPIAMTASPFARGTALDPTVSRLRAAATDRRTAGVLLYVDSPGGSALASDLIHHEVERLAEKKPVVAYFGEVAASGGYYVGVAAKRIVAQPQTVTGSIGVVGARFVASALLERLGVAMQTVATAPHADLFGIDRVWSDEERALFSRELASVYGRFLEIVARGRGRTVDEVEPWAGGRVWSGRDALGLGMIDALGGLEVAMQELRELLPELSAARLAALRPVWPSPPTGPVPPPLPAGEGQGALWGELVGLEPLLRSDERVHCYAPGLPRVL